MFIYFWERDKAWVGRDRERGRHRVWRRHHPGFELSAQSPTQGSNSRTWDHDLSWRQRSHPGTPRPAFLTNSHAMAMLLVYKTRFDLQGSGVECRKILENTEVIIHEFPFWNICNSLLVCAEGGSLTCSALRDPTPVTWPPSKLFLSFVMETTLAKQPTQTTP